MESKKHDRDCKAWLRSLLADGPVRSNVILKRGQRAGFDEPQIRQAKIAIGAIHYKSIPESGRLGSGKWVWELVPPDERLPRALHDLAKMRRALDRLAKRIETAMDKE